MHSLTTHTLPVPRADEVAARRDAGVGAVGAVARGAAPALRAGALPADARPPPNSAALYAVLTEKLIIMI